MATVWCTNLCGPCEDIMVNHFTSQISSVENCSNAEKKKKHEGHAVELFVTQKLFRVVGTWCNRKKYETVFSRSIKLCALLGNYPNFTLRVVFAFRGPYIFFTHTSTSPQPFGQCHPVTVKPLSCIKMGY